MKLQTKQTRSVAAALCLFLLTSVLVGCGKPTSGVFSHNDYAYSADTAEQVSQARARYDRTVHLFQSAGLRTVSSTNAEKSSETVLKAPGKEAQLAFALPDNGFATITLVCAFEGSEAHAKTEAESLLARVQAVLNPNQPSTAPK